MSDKIRDVIIIGGGPAGLSSGIYLSRERIDTLILEKAICGGWMNITGTIENYPGFQEGIDGALLSKRFKEQAEKFGVEIRESEEAKEVKQRGNYFTVRTNNGEYHAHALILAPGSKPRKLGIPGEAEFLGRGVSYCATCDGPLYGGKTVAVVGGGDAAMEEALFLTKFASKVYLVHRRDQLRGAKILEEELHENPRAEFILDAIPVSVNGENVVHSITLRDRHSGKEREVKVSGVFIFVGVEANSGVVKGMVEMDALYYIKTDVKMRTSRQGMFAVGDVRSGNMRQIAIACGEGVVAALSLRDYLKDLERNVE